MSQLTVLLWFLVSLFFYVTAFLPGSGGTIPICEALPEVCVYGMPR
jgi:hypothetical protein